MSSGNLIQHAYIKEVTYGVTPGSGTWQAIAKTSASFSGTPETTQSSTVRSDRMPSGQVITGLSVSGSINNELAKSTVHDDFLESVMMSTWPAAAAAIVTDLAYDGTAGTLTTAAAIDFTAVGANKVEVGDIVKITGLIAPNLDENGSVFFVTNVAAQVLTVVAGLEVDDWDATAGAGASMQRAPYITIGSTQTSYTFEKQYLDLTNRAIDYAGQLFSGFNASFNYGAPVTVDYSLMGNGKDIPGTPLTQPGGAAAVTAAPSEIFFNPSTSMPFLAIDDTKASYCVEGVTLTLDNGLIDKNCISTLKKAGYDLGTANVQVGVNAHFDDNNFDLLQSIMDQDVIEFVWPVIDPTTNTGYAFKVSTQLSADDPDVSGRDSQSMLNLTGSGALGTDDEVLRIYKID